jgi:uncharacterized membrane protein YkvA (DUF1232 family)
VEKKEEEKAPKGFNKAKGKAEKLLDNKQKLAKLLKEGEAKAKAKKAKLKGVWADIQTLFSLLKAWQNRSYTKVPWKTIIYIVAALIYFINPFDLVPDFIPGLGLVDDLSILTFVINSVKSDIEAFKKWETEEN